MLSLFVLLAFLCVASAQVETKIPLAPNARAFHRGNLTSVTTVDFFIDLTCSSCLDEWPLISQVYDAYKNDVHFLYHLFPLPYHQQGFIVNKAAQVVNYFGPQDAVFDFFDVAFKNQAQIYNSATADKTYNDVVSLVEPWVTGLGITHNQYVDGMNSNTPVGSNIEMTARYFWKYTTLQGVFATPYFHIDGLEAGGLDTFADWQAALDPLVA